MTEIEKLKKELREAVANYMRSEGCSCCRSIEAHKANEKRLAKLLGVRPYKDDSGFDFAKYGNDKTYGK